MFAAFAVPALITPVWYGLLRNHSQIHEPFTYANVPAAVGVVMAAAILAARSLDPPGEFASRRVVEPARRASLRRALARTVAMTGEPSRGDTAAPG